MASKQSRIGPLAGFVLLAVALSGCGGTTDEEGTATPTPSPSPTEASGETNETMMMVPPGEAYNKTATYGSLQSAATGHDATMKVTTNWTSLTFKAQLRKIQGSPQCAILQNEPPPAGQTSGPPPRVVFRSAGGTVVTLALATQNECTAAAGKLGTGPTDTKPNEMADWTVTVNGRGQNVAVDILVTGK